MSNKTQEKQIRMLRCRECKAEISSKEVIEKEIKCCPSCGSKVAPQMVAEEVTLTINRDDLRIMATMAMTAAYAAGPESISLLYPIIQEINKLVPEGSDPILNTIVDGDNIQTAIQELADTHGELEVHHPDGAVEMVYSKKTLH